MRMDKGGYTYIMANKSKTVLYTGVTSDIQTRTREHKEHKYPDSFSARYNCHDLMWFEQHPTIELAIAYEKKIKAGSRAKKVALIEAVNPQWIDLYDSLY